MARTGAGSNGHSSKPIMRRSSGRPRNEERTPSEQAGPSSRSTTATLDTNSTETGMRRSRSGRKIMPVARKDDLGGVQEDEFEKGKNNSKRAVHTNAGGSKRGRRSTTFGKRGRKSKTETLIPEEEEVDSPQPPTREESEEERAKRKREEVELMERWHEEYFEIVEQLPLELQRSYALMREMEKKFQERIELVASQSKAYRDARIAYSKLTPEQKTVESIRENKEIENAPAKLAFQPDQDIASSDADAEGEDDAEVFHELAGDLPIKSEVERATSPDLQSEQQDSDGQKQGEAIDPTPSSNSTKDTPSDDIPPPPNSTTNLAPTRFIRLSLLASIAHASSESIKIAEEKVGLAVTAYDWIDRQIRRLDADLQKSENTLLLGLRAGTEASRGLQDALGIDYTKGQGAHRWDDVENLLMGRPSGNRSQANKMTNAAIEDRESSSEGVGKKRGIGNNKSKDQNEDHTTGGDMAVDPNEPTYCYCDEVSSGEMVACDNEDCPREWFHLPCVGFTQPPKGRWFCLFCAPAGYKGSGTYPPDAPCLPLHLLAFNPNANGSSHNRKRSSKAGSGAGRNKRRK